MLETVEAHSGDTIYTIVLDKTTGEWTSATHPAEGGFPLIADADGKRYEIYSDSTFAEVEEDENESDDDDEDEDEAEDEEDEGD